jgi:HlyD family secretion protein
MWKSKKVWIAVAIILAIGWWFIGKSNNSKPYAARVTAVPESNFAAVAKGKIDVEGGIIKIAARSAGVFREVFVKEGDLVVPGQVLAIQEDDEQQIALLVSEAQLQSTRAGLTRLEVRREIAQREYDRVAPLVDIDAASPQELDQRSDDLRQIDVDIISQKASIRQSEASLESAKFRLEQRTVRAPVAGRIIEAEARPGVGASTFQVSTAFTLMPDAQKIVRADLDQTFVGKVFVGQLASISPDSRPQETYDGKVLRVSEIFGKRSTQPTPGQGGGSDFTIEVVVGAGDIPLLIGQRVMVRFRKDGEDAQ